MLNNNVFPVSLIFLKLKEEHNCHKHVLIRIFEWKLKWYFLINKANCFSFYCYLLESVFWYNYLWRRGVHGYWWCSIMDHLFDLFFNDYHLFLLIQKRSSIDSFIFFFDPDFFVHLFTYELSSLPTSWRSLDISLFNVYITCHFYGILDDLHLFQTPWLMSLCESFINNS